MAFKTILVHVADDPDNAARLMTAQRLAKQEGAHLTALFAARSIEMPITGRGASLAFLESGLERARELAQALEEQFRSSCEARGQSHDWIVEDKEHLDSLARHAHAADLVVVSRSADQHLEDRFRLRLAEELVLITGLPILALPPGYRAPERPPGKRVLVAWKPTREALRALRDALPLLRRAEKTFLVTVGPKAKDAVSLLEVSQFLQRHDVSVETRDVAEGEGGAGQTLIDQASAHGCDLIVAGAYGHARLRQVLMGGVSRRLLRHAPQALLLSH